MSALLPSLFSARSMAFKLACVLASFGVLASGLTGYYSYHATRAILVRAAGDDMLMSTQVLGRRFTTEAHEIGNDARQLARLALTRAVFQDGPEGARAKALLADQFAAMLAVSGEYFQLRLIDAAGDGVELVRVDRDVGGVSRIPEADLQEKGHFPYVYKTRGLAPGQVHYSNVFINRETGAHAGLDKPTLQVSTPVHEGGKTLGIIVVNVDLNRVFALLKTDLAPALAVFLANQDGDYLIHPDQGKVFGFEQGRRFLVQDDFAPVAAIVTRGAHRAMIGADPEQPNGGSIGSFVRIPFGDSSGRLFVILGLTEPLEQVLGGTGIVAVNTLQIVAGFSLAAVVLAVLVANALARPLGQLINAVEQFARNRELTALPTGRHDELGVLARSVDKMEHDILAHVGQINERKNLMEHQATHDALTGARNRSLFANLLEMAVHDARRDGTELALLFIDLDHFKEINDGYGHAAGDAVLIEVTRRLERTVRENDVVARLGGDEFVLLFPSFGDDSHVALVARKIGEALQRPVQFRGFTLEVAASIGISMFPRDGASADELLNNADKAMYKAKRDGRNNFKFLSETPVA